jgi:hypothetical protein
MTTVKSIETATWKLANYLDIAMSAVQVPAVTKEEEYARLTLEIAVLNCLKDVQTAADTLMEEISTFAEEGTPKSIYVLRDALERYQNAPTPD